MGRGLLAQMYELLIARYIQEESRRLLGGFRGGSRWGWVGAEFGHLKFPLSLSTLSVLTLLILLWKDSQELTLILSSEWGKETKTLKPLGLWLSFLISRPLDVSVILGSFLSQSQRILPNTVPQQNNSKAIASLHVLCAAVWRVEGHKHGGREIY